MKNLIIAFTVILTFASCKKVEQKNAVLLENAATTAFGTDRRDYNTYYYFRTFDREEYKIEKRNVDAHTVKVIAENRRIANEFTNTKVLATLTIIDGELNAINTVWAEEIFAPDVPNGAEK